MNEIKTEPPTEPNMISAHNLLRCFGSSIDDWADLHPAFRNNVYISIKNCCGLNENDADSLTRTVMIFARHEFDNKSMDT